jgi:hypothetical protein
VSPTRLEANELRPDTVEVVASLGDAQAGDDAKDSADQTHDHAVTSSA